MRASIHRALLLSAAALLFSGPAGPALLAQPASASIPVADASAFLGAWTVNATAETGPVTLRVELSDQDGRVAARITGGEAEGRTVQRVSRTPEGGLAIGYSLTIQGQAIPTVLTLTPSGATTRATIVLGDGMLTLTGEARKDP